MQIRHNFRSVYQVYQYFSILNLNTLIWICNVLYLYGRRHTDSDLLFFTFWLLFFELFFFPLGVSSLPIHPWVKNSEDKFGKFKRCDKYFSLLFFKRENWIHFNEDLKFSAKKFSGIFYFFLKAMEKHKPLSYRINLYTILEFIIVKPDLKALLYIYSNAQYLRKFGLYTFWLFNLDSLRYSL